MQRIMVSLGAVLALVGIQQVLAATNPYAGTGYDVSYPNCSATPPSASFGIIGVGGGRAFTDNSCLGPEFTAASQLSSSPTLYMNLNYAIGPTGSEGTNGPYGTGCHHHTACFAENYGWNAAQAAFSYAASQGATSTIWWLDIETSNSWSPNTSLNQDIIDGAVYCLDGQALAGSTPNDGSLCSGTTPAGSTVTASTANQVGIYSSAGMWQTITGGWTNGLPEWLATFTSSASAASARCGTPPFTGGTIWLAQYVSGIDYDYAC